MAGSSAVRPGAAASVADTGKRDVHVGAGEIVDPDLGNAFDPLPGRRVDPDHGTPLSMTVWTRAHSLI